MTSFQITYFMETARLLSFTAAAGRLYITQPALSRQINALETELGVALFTRKNNSLALTPAGAYLYEHMPAINAQLRDITQHTRDIGNGLEGRLRIGLMEDQTISPRLVDAIQSLLKLHPQLMVDVNRGDYITLLKLLNDGSIDLCQSLLYEGMPDDLYQMRVLSTTPVCLAYNPKYLTLNLDFVSSPEELSAALGDCPLVCVSRDCYPAPIQDALTQNLLASGSCIKHLRVIHSFSSAHLYLSCGIAAGFTNRNSLIASDSALRLIPSALNPLDEGLIWLKQSCNPFLPKLLALIGEEG